MKPLRRNDVISEWVRVCLMEVISVLVWAEWTNPRISFMPSLLSV